MAHIFTFLQLLRVSPKPLPCVFIQSALFVKPRPHQQQYRSNVRLCCQKRQQCRTSFALKFRAFDKVENCFDKVECCFDVVAGVDRAWGFSKE